MKNNSTETLQPAATVILKMTNNIEIIKKSFTETTNYFQYKIKDLVNLYNIIKWSIILVPYKEKQPQDMQIKNKTEKSNGCYW